jgi:hypothetical protein
MPEQKSDEKAEQKPKMGRPPGAKTKPVGPDDVTLRVECLKLVLAQNSRLRLRNAHPLVEAYMAYCRTGDPGQ